MSSGSSTDARALEEENQRLRCELEAMRRILAAGSAESPAHAPASSPWAAETTTEQTEEAVAVAQPGASEVAAAEEDARAEGEGTPTEEGRAPPASADVLASPLPAQAAEASRERSRRRSHRLREASWSWLTEAEDGRAYWRPYDPDVCALVEQAFQMGQKAVCLSQDHVIVFHDMEQRLIEDAARPPPTPLTKSGSRSEAQRSGRAVKGRTAGAPLLPQAARPVRRHPSCGRAEALILLRERNASLRDGVWRAQLQQQLLREQFQAELGSAARRHAILHATHASSSAAAAAAAATVAAKARAAGVAGQISPRAAQGINGGGGGEDELATIGICLEHDALLGVVFVSSIRPGGSAALSGRVAVGDVILQVNDREVASLEDAAELLVGPAGSLVTLQLLWRGQTARVALVRQHTLVVAAGDGGQGDIGADIDLRMGLLTLIGLEEGGAAAASQGLLEGDVLVALDGELPATSGAALLDDVREALKGPVWSRTILTVARKDAGEKFDVAVVRAPVIGGGSALFAARVAYQAALVEAVQRGARQEGEGVGDNAGFLHSVKWAPAPECLMGMGVGTGEGGAESGRNAGGLRGIGSLLEGGREGGIRATVRGLSEDIGGTATEMQATLHEHVSEVTSQMKENLVRGVDKLNQGVEHVSETVVEGIAPVLESRWKMLQVGSHVTGFVRTAVATVKGQGAAGVRGPAGLAPIGRASQGRGVQSTSRIPLGAVSVMVGGGGPVWTGGAGLAAAAEGRVTVGGGVVDEMVLGFSDLCVETLSVNGCEYGASLLGFEGGRTDAQGGTGGVPGQEQRQRELVQVRAVKQQVMQIHVWKEGSGRDARIKYLRMVFADGSDLEAGLRGAGGVYKGLVLDGAPFRVRYSSFRVLDFELTPGTKAHTINHSAAVRGRTNTTSPPSSPSPAITSGLEPAGGTCVVSEGARQQGDVSSSSRGTGTCQPTSTLSGTPASSPISTPTCTQAQAGGRREFGQNVTAWGQALDELGKDINIHRSQIPEGILTALVSSPAAKEHKSSKEAASEAGRTLGHARAHVQTPTSVPDRLPSATQVGPPQPVLRPAQLGLSSAAARSPSAAGAVNQGAVIAGGGAGAVKWLRSKEAKGTDADSEREFESISCQELWESLTDEGEPVPDDPSVFRLIFAIWRDKTLLQPFWSNGSLVVRAVPSGELVYRGRPGAMKDGLVSNGDVEQLCGLFPGRLGVSQARRLLRSVGGDVDVALAVLMDECESE